MKNFFPILISVLFAWAALMNWQTPVKALFYLFSAAINVTILFM